jgi:site-specific DNA recombinase
MDSLSALLAGKSPRLQEMSIAAGIYCRISDDKAGAGLGVERQRNDCLEIAKRRGWRVVNVYTDNDISAYSGKPRPEYRRLLDDIERGLIGAVVVWHLDRLHRQPKELESFIDIVERHRVALASVAGEHDLGSPEGRLHARILGAVARMESEHKSRRIRRQKLEAIKRGQPLGGGYRAYGFESNGMRVVQSEAAVIREVAERVVGGDSLRSICFDLNRRKLFTSIGKGWTPRSLTRVVASPRTVGLIEHPELGSVKAAWPAILTERQRDELLLLFGRRKSGRLWKCKYLLSGLLRCGECGAPLVAASARNKRGRAYICYPYANRGCNKVSISAGWLEPFMAEATLCALDKLRIKPESEKPREGNHEMEALKADRGLLEELARAYAQRRITLDEWMTARGPIELRIETAIQTIARDSESGRALRVFVGEQHIRDVWEKLSTDQQRIVVSTVLDHVVVNRVGQGSYKDPSRLQPIWRV